jgi:predicted transcriptional regulator
VEHLIKANACINSDLVQETGLAQATVSQHLKELKAVGIIQGSIEGVSMSYCINKSRWREISESLSHLFGRIDTSMDGCC